MSLLTPAELATRGAMFLSDSNKSSSNRGGGSNVHSPRAKLTGLSLVLSKAVRYSE